MACKFNGLADVHHGAELRRDELNVPEELAYPTPIEQGQAGHSSCASAYRANISRIELVPRLSLLYKKFSPRRREGREDF